MRRKKVDHTTIRNGALFCTHCGSAFKLPFPMSTGMFSAITKQFNKDHGGCAKTWVEPQPDFSKAPEDRAEWWLQYGEHGMSSCAIFTTITGRAVEGKREISHPHDPSDFNRCHKLLVCVPEFRQLLHLMKKVSPEWENLVNNWDKLTTMLEEQLKTNKPNGMYELMHELTHIKIEQ